MGEGGGGGRIGIFLTGQCFSFTVKALQKFFFSNLPPLPPPPQKSNLIELLITGITKKAKTEREKENHLKSLRDFDYFDF